MLEDIVVKDNPGFTPPYKRNPPASTDDPLTGISLRNLPVDVTVDDINNLLKSNRLSSDVENVSIKRFKLSAAADVEGIDEESCKLLLEKLKDKDVAN